MPQIDAPTVAEHRAQQREALLDAAEAILLDAGHGALTFRALGERTGLARNSIYRYFGSRDDLIAARHEPLGEETRDRRGDAGDEDLQWFLFPYSMSAAIVSFTSST